MLAGRLRSAGPYGWHGENATIADRLFAGFQLHREAWGSIGGGFFEGVGERLGRIDAISDFAQSGLMPPPMVVHPMTDQEKRGKELFESKSTQCSTCHVAGGGMTDRKAHELAALPVRPGFDAEEKQAWKTPSLWFIAGSAPYFHDGSSASLESLVKQNGTRMGSTSQLSADDQAALVAYLKTL
jgi:mono/diheme cytochrome c family protein